MFCKGEVVLRAEEVLFLLPSNLFNEVFLDCIGPYPQVLILLYHHELLLIMIMLRMSS